MKLRIGRTTLTLVQADITQQAVDAIVNAANSSLMGGGGVDGAIHRAGGPRILEECRAIRSARGDVHAGEAVMTGGGLLKAAFVIHAVGPVWRGGEQNEEALLRSAYHNSLALAAQNKVKTLAFPSISTGAYGFPVEHASKIAFTTVKEFVEKDQTLDEVRFVVFSDHDREVYEPLFKVYGDGRVTNRGGAFDRLREPVNGLSHLLGAVLSAVGFSMLVFSDRAAGKTMRIIAFSVYGVSLVALYSASALYHLVRVSERVMRFLRMLDHVMIYVLIAGTYTPICLIALQGEWGWSLLAAAWLFAFVGIIFTLFWLSAPRWLSTSLYVLMGWMAVVAVVPLVQAVPFDGLLWLAAGGLFYTAGAIMYAKKRPNPIPGWLGFHETWHLCVMAGSFCHFWMIWRYVSFMN